MLGLEQISWGSFLSFVIPTAIVADGIFSFVCFNSAKKKEESSGRSDKDKDIAQLDEAEQEEYKEEEAQYVGGLDENFDDVEPILPENSQVKDDSVVDSSETQNELEENPQAENTVTVDSEQQKATDDLGKQIDELNDALKTVQQDGGVKDDFEGVSLDDENTEETIEVEGIEEYNQQRNDIEDFAVNEMEQNLADKFISGW